MAPLMFSIHAAADAALLVEQAFVFAYPLVVAGQAPTNRLAISRERPDTLRIAGWLDLRGAARARDARHARPLLRAVAARRVERGVRDGRRAHDRHRPHAFVLLGPDHHAADLPPGLTRIAAPTRLVERRRPHRGGRRDGRRGPRGPALVVALSRWPHALGSESADATAPDATLPEIDAESFFAAFWRLVDDNPPRPRDREALERLGAVAPRTGLEPALRDALEAGVRSGRDAVRAAAALPHGDFAGGWRVSYERGRYGTDYLRRAAMPGAGFGAEPAIDEFVAVRDTDENGEPLTGGASYLLRFAPDRAPPVDGFWALTACDDARPATRWRSLSDLHGLRADTDGSIPVYVRHRPPARRLSLELVARAARRLPRRAAPVLAARRGPGGPLAAARAHPPRSLTFTRSG